MEPGHLHISLIDEETAREIVSWCYPPPYDLYNITHEETEETISAFLDPAFQYYQIRDADGKLAAFFNFGVDARVRGGDYSQDALDIGLGLHPAMTGQGRGSVFVGAVLRFANENEQSDIYRVTIAGFNTRARRVWGKAGFKDIQVFQRPLDGLEFVILTARKPVL